jgi:hypothetical protein
MDELFQSLKARAWKSLTHPLHGWSTLTITIIPMAPIDEFQLSVSPEDTIRRLKEKIYDRLAIPLNCQQLLYEEQLLDNDALTLGSYHLPQPIQLRLLITEFSSSMEDLFKVD